MKNLFEVGKLLLLEMASTFIFLVPRVGIIGTDFVGLAARESRRATDPLSRPRTQQVVACCRSFERNLINVIHVLNGEALLPVRRSGAAYAGVPRTVLEHADQPMD